MLCKRYGVDAKEYEISKLDGVFQGQVPREDIPAALTDMRDAFKSLNGRMARAMGLTRDSKQKDQNTHAASPVCETAPEKRAVGKCFHII